MGLLKAPRSCAASTKFIAARKSASGSALPNRPKSFRIVSPRRRCNHQWCRTDYDGFYSAYQPCSKHHRHRRRCTLLAHHVGLPGANGRCILNTDGQIGMRVTFTGSHRAATFPPPVSRNAATAARGCRISGIFLGRIWALISRHAGALKGWRRDRKIELIERNNPTWRDLRPYALRLDGLEP